jgi:hypothetical protein
MLEQPPHGSATASATRSMTRFIIGFLLGGLVSAAAFVVRDRIDRARRR